MAFANVKVAAEAETPRRAGELDFGGLERLMGFNVRLAQAAFYRDYAVAMKDLDLTQKQFAVLALISANPGVSQIDLAATLGGDRATMMAIVDRLQGRGYLERVPSTIDRRRQELHLTALGGSVHAKAAAICEASEKRFLADFSPEELRALSALLRRLHAQRAPA